VHQSALAVHPDVHLHAEVPLLALFTLVHLRVAALRLVLRRGRGGNQGGIHDGASAELQAVGLQQLPDLGEQPRADLVPLEQVAKLQQRGGIGHPLAPQVDAAKLAKGGYVVERLFAGLVGEVEPIGHKVHAQHTLQADRRAAVAGLGVMRFNQRTELAPRNQALHARQKLGLARGPTVDLKALRRR